MTIEEFRKHGHETVDWIADYYSTIEKLPVKSRVQPGEIFSQIPDSPPDKAEAYSTILEDLNTKIIPGMTHWQHPNFHAYFPGNSSFPSLLGEMVTSALAAQCMVWDTSPAAAELEEKMMLWLKQMMNLPKSWHGVIQDTASTGTLVALLSARENTSRHDINLNGFGERKFRVYCSSQTHSSIDKAVKIAGIGISNLVKIDTDQNLAMDVKHLKQSIMKDIDQGFTPCAVVSTLGTTGTMAMDPVPEIAEVCREFGIWHHVDAAYVGSAFLLPEYQHYTKGFETVDSYLFNPHKWMFTNFDCSAYFVRDRDCLIKTFEILPEYLKTRSRGKVNDYRDWGIQLGRRFRALKLWFVIRDFGVSGLQSKMRQHIGFSEWIEDKINDHSDFEMVVPRIMNMVVFRYCPGNIDPDHYDKLNEQLLDRINQSGSAYLTHTKVSGNYVIRLVTAQTYLEWKHVENVWKVIVEESEKIL